MANAEVAAAPGKSLDSIDQWSRLVSGVGDNPRTEVVLRNDPGMWGFREHRTCHARSFAPFLLIFALAVNSVVEGRHDSGSPSFSYGHR